MKAIILAAGYATRLYPLTLTRPKPLLEIHGRPMIDYIVDEINTIDSVDEILVVTNQKFHEHFLIWKENVVSNKNIKIINDGTTTEDTRLGAIGDINFVIHHEKIDDDIIVVAGDNFFTYKLLNYYNYFLSVNSSCICVKKIDDINILRRIGVVLIDKNNKVLDLEEKPQNPKSNLGVYATYIYKKEILPLFDQYIKEGNNHDAPTYFPTWLYKHKDLFAYIFEEECYDIGTHEAYEMINRDFDKIKK